MAERARPKERLRYRFDDFMSQGPSSGFVALTVVFFACYGVITLARVVTVWLMGDVTIERGGSIWRQVWIAFLEMTDPGSMTQDIDSDPAIKIFAVLAGMTGLVLLSALIAVITNALDQRLSDLRKGHSKVVLEDHTVILGWNGRIFDLLRELILANESESSAAVVVLADRPKEEMDDQLALLLPDRATTKIVTRSGVESSLANLSVASVTTCRSVIVLADAEPGSSQDQLDRSDMKVVKTVLGVGSALSSREDVPIVAELFSEERRALARSMEPDRLVALDAEEMLAKILVQTSRNEGLAVVYEEILSFDGSEIYLYNEGPWPTSSFGTASYFMPDGVAIGLKRGDDSIELNPDPATQLEEDDQLIVLASDDSTIGFETSPVVQPTRCAPGRAGLENRIERELFIGWTPKVPTIVKEYADYVQPGSRIDIVARGQNGSTASAVAELALSVPALQLQLLDVDPSDTAGLLQLRPFEYDNIIVLSDAGSADSAEWADSETLLHLLQLQKIFREQTGSTSTKLIAELLDSDNRELVTSTGIREFVISNRFVSMLMAQVSESIEMKAVYDNLLSEDGSEIYLKPLDFYMSDPPESVSYADLILSCQGRREVALGYRLRSLADDINANFGVRLIPPKADQIPTADIGSVVVMAEDES